MIANVTRAAFYSLSVQFNEQELDRLLRDLERIKEPKQETLVLTTMLREHHDGTDHSTHGAIDD